MPEKVYKVLIIDDLHPAFQERLAQTQAFEVVYQPNFTEADLAADLSWVEILVVRSKFFFTDDVLSNFPNLRIICRAGAGMDNIDLSAAQARNIEILNAPEGNRDAVAEHVLGMLLNMCNKMQSAQAHILQKEWLREQHRGREISSLTIGLIGLGNNGYATAKLLLALGAKVMAYDKYLIDWPNPAIEKVALETLQANVDVISLHIPLTTETRQMVNQEFWEKVSKPTYFINAARGEIVDTSALNAALESGKVLAAALDVLHNEKPQTWDSATQVFVEKWTGEHRLIITPHVAGWSVESYQKISEVLGEKLVARLGV